MNKTSTLKPAATHVTKSKMVRLVINRFVLHDVPSVDADRVIAAGTTWHFKHRLQSVVVKQESGATVAEICAALCRTGSERLASFPPPFEHGIAVHDALKEQFPSRLTMDVQLVLARDIQRVAPKWHGFDFKKVVVIATGTTDDKDVNPIPAPFPAFQTVLGGCNTSLEGWPLWLGGGAAVVRQ